MAERSPDERELSRSEYETYNVMATTFIKRERPIEERGRRPDGSYIDDPRLPQRFSNEVATDQLLREKTTIPSRESSYMAVTRTAITTSRRS
jgi:hypothetical protein